MLDLKTVYEIQMESKLFRLKRLFNQMIFGDLDQACIQAASEGRTADVWMWVGRGANPCADDNSALVAAYKGGHENTVLYLLEEGADHEKIGVAPLYPIVRTAPDSPDCNPC